MTTRTIITLIICAMMSLTSIATPHTHTCEQEHATTHYDSTIEWDGCDVSIATTSDADATSELNACYATEVYDDEIEFIPAKDNTKKKKKKKKSFNSPKTKSFWGFTAGYTSKRWRKKTATGQEEYVYFVDGRALHGVQLGARYNPLFKYGFGLDVALFYEYYHYRYTTSDAVIKDLMVYRTLNEHVIRLPLHLEYRLNFSKTFQLFVFGGIAADYIIAGNMIISDQNTPNSDANKVITDIYGKYIPSESRFNTAFSFGGGFRFGAIQFNVSSARGFYNGAPSNEYTLMQDNPLNITMSVMF